jgi:class 3 adenylate cyclase
MNCPLCFHSNPIDAKFCNQCAHDLNAPGIPSQRIADRAFATRSALEGERKQVSVLFADVKGSTEMVARGDPEDAREILDPVLELMMEGVRHYQGTVNQLTGDGVMALFGAPVAQEDHAARACSAALRIQMNLARHREKLRRDKTSAPPQVRVGVNSGEVVVRSLTTDLNPEYTAVGLTTHLASRMEQMAVPGSVLITADTFRLAQGSVEAISLGLRTVAGVEEQIDVYELVSARDMRSGPRESPLQRLQKFVGRDGELAFLSGAIALARRGMGQFVAIVGDAGIGKSRLLHEFVLSSDALGAVVLRTGCLSYGPAKGYSPLVKLLQNYFSIARTDDKSNVRQQVLAKLQIPDPFLDAHAVAVLALLDALPDGSLWDRLDSGRKRQAILAALKDLVQQQSELTPLILVFEDLQGIDAESWWVLNALLDGLSGLRLLVLATSRPVSVHPWGDNPNVQRLRVAPLSRQSVEELLDIYIGTSEDLLRVREQLIERTQGNPLFIEECVSALQETGALTGAPGMHQAGQPIQAAKVPATVQAIIAARIDRLADADMRLLQAAAVFGKEFSLVPLQAIAELENVEEVQFALARLQSGGFVSVLPTRPHTEYSFKHALIHEVVYSSLLNERRRELHERALVAIETIYCDSIGEYLENLAHHALQAGLTDKAIGYAKRSGDKAGARSASHEAIRYYEDALALLARVPESEETLATSLSARLGLGVALRATRGAWDREVEGCYTKALELCDRLGSSTERFPILFGLWSCHSSSGQYGRAAEATAALLDIAATGTEYMRLEANHSRWSTTIATGRPEEALRYISLSQPRHRRQDDDAWWKYGTHDPIACSYQMSAIGRWLLGDYKQARTDAARAIQRATQGRHPFTTVLAYQFAAVVHYHCGDRGAAKLNAKTASSLGRLHGITAWPAHVSMIVARLLADEGRIEEALRLVEQNLPAALQAGWPWSSSISFGIAADVYGMAGQHRTGLDMLQSLRATDYAGFYGPELHRLFAKLLLMSAPERAEEAQARLYAAVELARDKQLKALQLRAAIDLAYCLGSRNRAAARDALSVIDDFGDRSEAADLNTARALRKWLA